MKDGREIVKGHEPDLSSLLKKKSDDRIQKIMVSFNSNK